MELALTILDYASYIIGAAALVGIVIVLIRKFRVLSAIDTKAIPRHQQEVVRKKLAADRLQRKFERAGGWFQRFIKPALATALTFVKKTIQSLIQVERQLALKAAKKNAQLKERAKQQIQQLHEQAVEAEEEEDYVEAEQKYIEMISINPKSVEAYKQLGDLYMSMKDFKNGLETYKHILTLVEKKIEKPEAGKPIPQNTEVAEHYADVAEASMGLEEWDGALAAIEKSLQLTPNNPKFLDFLFEISMKRKDYDRADQALTKLKEVNPENKKLEEFIDQLARAEK